jgi:hypothetical protein
MKSKQLHTYTTYSIGCAIAWAIVWAIMSASSNQDALPKLRLFFAGWASGWTSATIARYVYPPPKTRRPSP